MHKVGGGKDEEEPSGAARQMPRVVDRKKPRQCYTRHDRGHRRYQECAEDRVANHYRDQPDEQRIERKKRERKTPIASRTIALLCDQQVLVPIPAVPERKQFAERTYPLTAGYLKR